MHQMQETSALWGLLISERCHGNNGNCQSSFPLSLDFILDSDNMKHNMRQTEEEIYRPKSGIMPDVYVLSQSGVCS